MRIKPFITEIKEICPKFVFTNKKMFERIMHINLSLPMAINGFSRITQAYFLALNVHYQI